MSHYFYEDPKRTQELVVSLTELMEQHLVNLRKQISELRDYYIEVHDIAMSQDAPETPRIANLHIKRSGPAVLASTRVLQCVASMMETESELQAAFAAAYAQAIRSGGGTD